MYIYMLIFVYIHIPESGKSSFFFYRYSVYKSTMFHSKLSLLEGSSARLIPGEQVL